jgi:hypothetical protein
MARKYEEKTIGEHKWLVQQLPGDSGLEMFAWLVRLFGQPLVMTAAGGTSLPEDANVLDPAVLFRVATAVGELRIPRGEMTALAKALLVGCQVDGRDYDPRTADIIFQGETLNYIKVLLFAVQVNFRDFLGGFAALRTLLQAPKPAASNSVGTTTSAGPSSAPSPTV